MPFGVRMITNYYAAPKTAKICISMKCIKSCHVPLIGNRGRCLESTIYFLYDVT